MMTTLTAASYSHTCNMPALAHLEIHISTTQCAPRPKKQRDTTLTTLTGQFNGSFPAIQLFNFLLVPWLKTGLATHSNKKKVQIRATQTDQRLSVYGKLQTSEKFLLLSLRCFVLQTGEEV